MYRTVSWGPAVGVGVAGTMFVNLSAIGKANRPNDPYFVGNELVAAELGRFLGLPVPPGCIVVDPNNTPHWASLDFNLTGNALPPIITPQFVQSVGDQVVADIVVFDLFIANSDRHRGNLAADYASNPVRYNLFDHSHCLLGGSHHGAIGQARLAAIATELAVDRPQPHGNRHCLMDTITDDRLMGAMLTRISQIPDFFIEGLTNSITDLGVPVPDAVALRDFLKDRRTALPNLIGGHKNAFPGIIQWSLL